MENNKKVKTINKSIFIRYFESDFLVWLSNREHFASMEGIETFLPEWSQISQSHKEFISKESFDLDQDEIVEEHETIFDGNEVGKLARIFFERKSKNPKEEIVNLEYIGFTKDLFAKTNIALKDEKVKIIYEAGFQYEKFSLRPDILIKNEDGTFDIIEVKASTTPKENHVLDLFYQYTVMTKLGYKIRNTKLLLLNNSYYLDGVLKLEELFEEHTFAESTAFHLFFSEKERWENIIKYSYNANLKSEGKKMEVHFNALMKKMTTYFKKNDIDLLDLVEKMYNKEFKNTDIAKEYFEERYTNLLDDNKEPWRIMKGFKTLEHKELLKYMAIVYFDNKAIGNKIVDSVLNFYRLRWLLRYQILFGSKGIAMSKLKPEMFNSKSPIRKPNAQTQIEFESKKTGIIRTKEIIKIINNNDLAESKMVFYDFESFKSPIPFLDNTKSYQQICFQYSIHFAKNLDELSSMEIETSKNWNHIKNRKSTYLEFIYKFIKDAYDEFKDDQPIKWIVYNKAFENTRLREFWDIIEKEETNQKIKEMQIHKLSFIIVNTFDLLDFFQKFDIYHKKFFGSFSIKSVLPVLFPKYSYSELEISNGSNASWEYKKYYFSIENNDEEKLMANLTEYCKLDTWAMVLIMKAIMNIKDALSTTKPNEILKIGNEEFEVRLLKIV